MHFREGLDETIHVSPSDEPQLFDTGTGTTVEDDLTFGT